MSNPTGYSVILQPYYAAIGSDLMFYLDKKLEIFLKQEHGIFLKKHSRSDIFYLLLYLGYLGLKSEIKNNNINELQLNLDKHVINAIMNDFNSQNYTVYNWEYAEEDLEEFSDFVGKDAIFGKHLLRYSVIYGLQALVDEKKLNPDLTIPDTDELDDVLDLDMP